MDECSKTITSAIERAKGKALTEEEFNCFKFTDELEKTAFPKIMEKCVLSHYKKKLFLVVLTTWHPSLRDGRAISFMSFGQNPDHAEHLKDIAFLNIELFGRETTLNERLLSFAGKTSNKLVTMIVDCSSQDSFLVSAQNSELLLEVGHIWNDLSVTTNQKYCDKLEEYKPLLTEYSPVDWARALRAGFAGWLKNQRQKALNKLLSNERHFKQLSLAVKEIGSPEERNKLNINIIKEGKKRILPITQNVEVFMSFLKFIQALDYYLPFVNGKADKVTSIAYFPKSPITTPSYGAAINLIGISNFNIDKNRFSFLKTISKEVSNALKGKEEKASKHDNLDSGLFRSFFE